MSEGRRILITGGAGFIGSHLIERLRSRYEITLFDNLQRNALARDVLSKDVRLIEGNVLDAQAMTRAMAGHTLVLHLAAIAGTRSVGKDSALTSKVNFTGTVNCLEAAADAGAKRVVAFSTSEVYGRRALDVSEDQPAQIPPADDDERWAYAASKLAAEHAAMAFHRAGRVEAVVVRPFNVYGPGQVGEGAIRDMVDVAVRGGPIVVKGDGTQIRSWCYVEDFVEGTVACLERQEAAGRIFNIGNPAATVDSNDLAATVARLSGGVPVTRVPATGPDVEQRRPSIERAKALLGFSPKIGLEEGIRRTIAWRRAV